MANATKNYVDTFFLLTPSPQQYVRDNLFWPKVNPNGTQVGGDHYVSDYQHWDLVADAYNNCYYAGQVSLYVVRAGTKDGEPAAKDYGKAMHFVQKMAYLWSRDKLSSPAALRHREVRSLNPNYDTEQLVRGVKAYELRQTACVNRFCSRTLFVGADMIGDEPASLELGLKRHVLRSLVTWQGMAGLADLYVALGGMVRSAQLGERRPT